MEQTRDFRAWQKLTAAHAKLKAAAVQIADAGGEGVLPAELAKLAGEVMTLASVTEIVAYAVRDESEPAPNQCFRKGGPHGQC